MMFGHEPILAVVVFLVVVLLVRRWIHGPLRSLPLRPDARLQFRMTDIYILAVQLALAAHFIIRYRGPIEDYWTRWECAAAASYLLITWIASIADLSKVSEVKTGHRILWVAIGAPVANALALAVPVSAAVPFFYRNQTTIGVAAGVLLAAFLMRMLAECVAGTAKKRGAPRPVPLHPQQRKAS